MEGCSMSIVKGEYSIWTAEMGWMAWARRRVAEETSERPRYLILPSLWERSVCGGLAYGDDCSVGVAYFFN